MQETLNHLGAQFLSFAWPMLWQSSLVIAVVFGVDRMLTRKLRASVRHALWLVVLAKLLLPPTLALPTSAAWWLFPAKSIVLPASLPQPKASDLNTSVVVYDDVPPDYFSESAPQTAPPRPKLDRAGWSLLATGAVSAGLLFWLLLRWWQLTRKVQKATPAENFPGLRETIPVNWSAGIRPGSITKLLKRTPSNPNAPVRIRIVDAQMSPAVCGLFRPVILLPRVLAEKLSAPQLRAVLLHEMIHLRRGDIWVNCAQSLLQIFYWWHPLVWFANARIRRVREEAVDDAVMLALAADADTYAPTLLEVAKLAFYRPLMSLGIIGIVGIIESRSALRQRVERLIDFHAPRKAGLSVLSFCGIFLFSAAALPMGQGPAQIVHAPQPVSQTDSSPSLPPTSPSTDPYNPPFIRANQPPHVQVNLPPVILISAAIYQIPPQALDKMVSDLNLHPAATHSDAWWSASPEEYANLKNQLTNSNFTSLARPRILTQSGKEARFFVGNDSAGTDIDCLPTQDGDRINLELHGMTTGHTAAAETNQFTIKASSTNHGGIVVRFPNDTNNTVIFLKIEIDPDHHSASSGIIANPNFQTAAQALEQHTQVKSLTEPETTVHTSRGENQGVIFPPRSSIDFGSSNKSPSALQESSRLDFPKIMAFKLEHPLDYASLEKELKSAGVQVPPTGLIYNRSAGVFAVHGTRDQLMRVEALILRLNGRASSAELMEATPSEASNTPNQNEIENSSPLVTRTFKVDPLLFGRSLDDAAPKTDEVRSTTNITAKARAVFSQFGVDFLNPAGKSIFYKDSMGLLFVKATESDLAAIECAVGVLNQTPLQIHLKARFIEVPKDTLKNFNDTLNAVSPSPVSLTGIVTSKNARLTLEALKSAKDAKVLGEPEVTLIAGRHVQMRATQVQTIVTNMELVETITNQGGRRQSGNSIQPQTSTIETGPVLDAIPYVLTDGYTIELSGLALDTTFLGYANTEKITAAPVTNSLGEVLGRPIVLPVCEEWHRSFHANLFDNQTLVLNLADVPAETQYSAAGKEHETAVAKYIHDYHEKRGAKDIVVLITATLIDTVGSRVHSDAELPFAQTKIPTQPAATDVVDTQFLSPPQRHAANSDATGQNSIVKTLVENSKVYFEMGKFDNARFFLDAALKIAPSNSTAQYYLDLINNAPRNAGIAMGLPKHAFIESGGQAILARLDEIRLNKVSYNGISLAEVLKQLAEQSRLYDPERKGVNFLINNEPAATSQATIPSSKTEPAPTIDPVTGSPIPLSSATTLSNSVLDVGSTIIKIPRLTNVRLADLLDAIVLVANRPIKYSIHDFAIVFSAKGSETPQLFMRTFRIDPDTLYKGLNAVFANDTVSSKVETNRDGLKFITTQTSATTPSALARAYFTSLGINLLSPVGKSVFFKDRQGILFVKATEDDLDIIERALQALNQAPAESPQQSGLSKSEHAELAAKLNLIHFPSLDHYSGETMTLKQVTDDLSKLSRQYDSEKIGIPISTSPAPPSRDGTDITSVSVKFPSEQNVTNVAVKNILDLILSHADHPLKYTILNNGIVFSFNNSTHNQRPYVLWPSEFQTSSNFTGRAAYAADPWGSPYGRNSEIEQDLMNRTLHNSNEIPPNIYIKSRFISVPKGTIASLAKYLNATNRTDGTPMGLLSQISNTEILAQLAGEKNVKILAEPEITVSSGRQAQIRCLETVAAITNLTFTNSATITPHVSSVDVGPVIEVIPSASANGFAIKLTSIPSLVEFKGYEQIPTKTTATTTNTSVSPVLYTQQVAAHVNLWDGQTLLLKGLESHTASQTNDVLVFITPTLVDATGARIHSDTDLIALPPFPPQSQ